MNFFKSIGHFIAGIPSQIGKGIQLIVKSGLTQEVIQLALPLVRQAATKVMSDQARREWVVNALIAQHVPESVARVAVELAYNLYQAEITKVGA